MIITWRQLLRLSPALHGVNPNYKKWTRKKYNLWHLSSFAPSKENLVTQDNHVWAAEKCSPFKVRLFLSKIFFICLIESPLKMKCFFFHLKSSFCSQDIQFFKVLYLAIFWGCWFFNKHSEEKNCCAAGESAACCKL